MYERLRAEQRGNAGDDNSVYAHDEHNQRPRNSGDDHHDRAENSGDKNPDGKADGQFRQDTARNGSPVNRAFEVREKQKYGKSGHGTERKGNEKRRARLFSVRDFLCVAENQRNASENQPGKDAVRLDGKMRVQERDQLAEQQHPGRHSGKERNEERQIFAQPLHVQRDCVHEFVIDIKDDGKRSAGHSGNNVRHADDDSFEKQNDCLHGCLLKMPRTKSPERKRCRTSRQHDERRDSFSIS